MITTGKALAYLAILPVLLGPVNALADETGPRRTPTQFRLPEGEEPDRRSGGAFIAGASATGGGAATVMSGVVVFFTANKLTFCGDIPCFTDKPGQTAQKVVGVAMLATGGTAILVGVPLMVWGGRRAAAADVRVGLGGVSSTFRF